MTHVYRHPKYWAELRKLQRIEKNKQAQTNKQQASNQQAPSANELDRGPPVGYSRTDDVTAIHGGHSSARSVQPKATSNTGDAPHMGPRNSAAETLHLEQHKYPGDRSSRMVQGYGPESSSKQQTPINKQQASNQQASNQQASKDSSTVDQEPGTTDPQA